MTFSYKYNNISEFCYPYTFEFMSDDFITYFYQSPNGDLSLTTYSNIIDNKVLEIRKDDNYQLYMIFHKFYQSLDDYKEKYGYKELFETGYFSWKSDAPANELASNTPFIYNYLNIVPGNDVYKLELINNIKDNTFIIEFNTDRSRYGILVLCVYQLLKDLRELTNKYHQITIDEYLYQKSLTKK